MSKGSVLRELIRRPGTLVVPGVHDALTAKLAARAGFAAAYISGSGISSCMLALPDIGLLTLSEVARVTRYVSEAVPIPLIVDADTGHGSALNVMRCVRELESAGAAGIQIEDQASPKRCGHLAGKTLVSVDEMLGKIRAAVAARRDPNFQVVARTDARAVEGLEQVVYRANRYQEAGADIVFPEALESAHEFQAVAKAVQAPLLANMTEFGKTPCYSTKDFEDWGYKIVLFPVSALRIASKAVQEFFAALRASGTQRHLIGKMMTRHELYEIIDYASYESHQSTFTPREA